MINNKIIIISIIII